MWKILYLVSIILANVITAKFQPLVWGHLLIPYGSFLIGCTFIFRDFTQNQIGRLNTYKVIGVALVLSGITSLLLGDGIYIAIASSIAFLVSETVDTEIYSRVKARMEYRVLLSGVVAGALDSLIFVIVGLSPLGLGVLTWNQVVFAVIGQFIIKMIMQVLAMIVIQSVKKDGTNMSLRT
jgi:queuosine precursor transporter